VLAWLSVWNKVQTCIWPSWCHCHSLSLASVKSRLVLPFWYRLTRVVPDKGPLNGCVCVYIYKVLFHFCSGSWQHKFWLTNDANVVQRLCCLFVWHFPWGLNVFDFWYSQNACIFKFHYFGEGTSHQAPPANFSKVNFNYKTQKITIHVNAYPKCTKKYIEVNEWALRVAGSRYILEHNAPFISISTRFLEDCRI